MIDLNTTRTEVRRFLSTLAEPGTEFEGETDVFAAGVLRSMHVLELINYLEDRFGVLITQRDLFAGHLRTVNAIAAFVAHNQRRAS